MSKLSKQHIGKWLAYFCAMALSAAALWAAIKLGAPPGDSPRPPLVIALPMQISAGAVFIGLDQKIFDRHNVQVSPRPFALGKQALQSMLLGNADLAVVADTPFMLAVAQGESIAAVATIFGSQRALALLARKDRGITSAADLVGKTVATTFGTNHQFFLDALLEANHIAKASLTISDLKIDAIAEALSSGRVDAATVLQPELARLQKTLGANATTLYGEDLFVHRFLLVGKQAYLARHAEEIRLLLAAWHEANGFVHARPAEARTIVAKSLGITATQLEGAFDANDFYLTLDQSLLLALSNQTRWAMQQGIVPAGPIPNYLNYLQQAPLLAVLPDAVKIIR